MPVAHIQKLNLKKFYTLKTMNFCQKAGIYELDKSSIKHLNKLLNHTIDNIINDKYIDMSFISKA